MARRKGQPHAALAALAAKQHGVVSVRQLETKLGYSESSIRRAVEARRLHRVRRGVFAVGHTELSLYGECLVAVFAAGPGSLLSYWSAGWLWDLGIGSPKPFHVTAPGPRRHKPLPPDRIHRARNIVDEDRALVEGIPVTSLARTLLDLAEVLPGERLRRVLKRAEERKVFDLGPVLAVIARSPRHRGAKRLQKALAIYRPASMTRSELERHFHQLVAEAALPQAHANYVVLGWEVDAYWPEALLVVELDTFGTHGTRASFESDRERDAELAEAGIATIRVTERRLLDDPGSVVKQVARLLAKRAAVRRRRASPPSPV